MLLLHDQNSELSRTLAVQAAELGIEIIAGPGEYTVSAYPSVVVTWDASEYQVPMYGPEGELLGVSWTGNDDYDEVIRMPISWEAVTAYVALKSAQQVGSTTATAEE